MKCIAFLLCIISLSSFSMDGLYQLPSIKKINNRLHTAGLTNFADESKIANAIGQRLFKPIFLHEYVSLEVKKYNANHREWKYQTVRIRSQQPTVGIIMRLLLKNHPGALQAVAKNYDGAFLQ